MRSINDPKNFRKLYWKYYIALENDIMSIEKYSTFEKDNKNSYSLEFLKIFQAICSEIDVVARNLCISIEANGKKNRINDYSEIITSHFEDFNYQNIISDKLNEILTPWKDWDKDSTPEWWTIYNKVKHERSTISTEHKKNIINLQIKKMFF